MKWRKANGYNLIFPLLDASKEMENFNSSSKLSKCFDIEKGHKIFLSLNVHLVIDFINPINIYNSECKSGEECFGGVAQTVTKVKTNNSSRVLFLFIILSSLHVIFKRQIFINK